MAKRAAPNAPAKKKKRGSTAAKATKAAVVSSPKRPPKSPTATASACAAKKTKTLDPDPVSPAAPTKSLASVSDLKDLASSSIDTFKRRLDTLHSDAIKEINASVSSVSKRLKVQTQACLQLAEESEKEYKMAFDKINESAELAKTSFSTLISEAHAAADRVRKVSIPELEKSMEKAIGYLRSQYKIPTTTA